MTSNSEKVTRYESVREILQTTEPSLSKLSLFLQETLQQREPPIPDPRHPVTYHRQFTLRNIKTVLLELHIDTLPLLTGSLYEIVLKTQSSLPDRELPYAGVYIGSYVHKNGTGPSVRDIVRLANVLMSPDAILSIIEPATLGDQTIEAVKMLGRCWKKTLKDMKLWRNVREVDGVTEDSDDSEGSEGEEDIKGEGAVPLSLRFEKFSTEFPYSPYYVGYAKSPTSRWSDHQRCTSLFFIDCSIQGT